MHINDYFYIKLNKKKAYITQNKIEYSHINDYFLSLPLNWQILLCWQCDDFERNTVPQPLEHLYAYICECDVSWSFKFHLVRNSLSHDLHLNFSVYQIQYINLYKS